jgi:hypothetical protein
MRCNKKCAPSKVMAGLGLNEYRASSSNGHQDSGSRRLTITKSSDIAMRATQWLWEDEYGCWIPMGALVLLGGRESVGKSTLCADLIAKVTTGNLLGDFIYTPRNVIVSTTEDDWSATIKPRLTAAGADMERVFQVNSVSPEGLEGTLSLPEDTKRLEELVKENDVAMIVLDPLLTMINAKLDTHKDAEVRRALEPIVRLAQTSGASMLGLIHVNKTSEGDLSTRVMGSKALVAVPRGVLFCAKYTPHQDSPSGEPWEDVTSGRSRYVFGQIKNNLAATAPHSIQYHMETEVVGVDQTLHKDIKASRLVIDKVIHENIEDIVLEQEKRKTKTASQSGKCEAWLVEFLTGKGEVPSQWVVKAGRDNDFSRDTVYRARRNLEDRITITNLATVPKTSTWKLSEESD